jgi:Fic family protein
MNGIDGRVRSLDVERLRGRVRAEYLEMPGLRLTSAQAARLLGLSVADCSKVLSELVSDGFLYHTKGQYLRGE